MGRLSLYHNVFLAEALFQVAHKRGVQVAGRADELAGIKHADADVVLFSLEHIEDFAEDRHLRPVNRRQAQIERLPRPLLLLRLRADKNITIFNQKLKRRAQIQSDIAPRRNGTYTVTLAFNDDESQPILKMELMVPKEVMAKDLAERFQKNPEQLYTGVLNTLFSEPDEGK